MEREGSLLTDMELGSKESEWETFMDSGFPEGLETPGGITHFPAFVNGVLCTPRGSMATGCAPRREVLLGVSSAPGFRGRCLEILLMGTDCELQRHTCLETSMGRFYLGMLEYHGF